MSRKPKKNKLNFYKLYKKEVKEYCEKLIQGDVKVEFYEKNKEDCYYFHITSTNRISMEKRKTIEKLFGLEWLYVKPPNSVVRDCIIRETLFKGIQNISIIRQIDEHDIIVQTMGGIKDIKSNK